MKFEHLETSDIDYTMNYGYLVGSNEDPTRVAILGRSGSYILGVTFKSHKAILCHFDQNRPVDRIYSTKEEAIAARNEI